MPTSNTRKSSNDLDGPKTGNTRPYDRNFQQNLIDHSVYPVGYVFPNGRVPPRPDNWTDIQQRLRGRRSSLSVPRFSEAKFEAFV